jgi:hypothetical protein
MGYHTYQKYIWWPSCYKHWNVWHNLTKHYQQSAELQRVLLGSCITADSQHTNIWISTRRIECGQIWLLWLCTGTHYVRHLFKITPLQSNKSQRLLNFNFHLLRQPSSGTTGLCPTSLPYHWPTPSAHTCSYCCSLCWGKLQSWYVLNTILLCIG